MLCLASGETGSRPKYTSNSVLVSKDDLMTPTCRHKQACQWFDCLVHLRMMHAASHEVLITTTQAKVREEKAATLMRNEDRRNSHKNGKVCPRVG